MDDVALIHKNKDELQKMQNITEEISKRYHLKFGQGKKPNNHNRKTTRHTLQTGTNEPIQHNNIQIPRHHNKQQRDNG